MKNSALCAVACVALAACVAYGLVDPSYQPSHVVGVHKTVFGATVSAVDYEAGLITLKVTTVCIGKFAPKQVVIEGGEGDPMAESPPLIDEVTEGDTVVAYLFKEIEGHENDGVVFSAAGHWHAVTADAGDPSKWTWNEAFGDAMYGTFNGSSKRLLEMMADTAAEGMYFPAEPIVRFEAEREIGRFEGRVRGVTLYDLDGDGDLDIYACHEKGGRAYVQSKPLVFVDATEALGLAGVAGVSCHVADADADGHADLLIDATIYRGTGRGFEKTNWLLLPEETTVKMSAFVEINGDGCPDVVVSRVGGGLALLLNGPGKTLEDRYFTDATKTAGLDKEECGGGQTGFFAPGDLNGDGRMDLHYAAGEGFLLAQDEKGVFLPLKHEMNLDYQVIGADEPGLTGAGCFAPLWRPGSWDVLAAGDMHITAVTREDGKWLNVARYGNEIRDVRTAHLGCLAADLNVDGYVDIFTICRRTDTQNMFHTNRGYGSFMLDENYPPSDYVAFPDKVYKVGAWGAAAGDVNGDGAPDLLLGGADGVLRLTMNHSLSLRKPRKRPAYHERIQELVAIVTVRVKGPLGVLNADVRLLNAEGETVGREVIGSKVLTGCRGPDAVSFAVRRPGRHTLKVRYGDGLTRTWTVELKPKEHRAVEATRDGSSPATQPAGGE